MPESGAPNDELRSAAEESMRDPEHIRDRVRALTLQALREQHFDAQGFVGVLKDVTEGISKGVSKHGEGTKAALESAFSGLDDAFTRAAHASSLAVKELAAKGKEFSDTELRQSLDQIRRLETDFLQTWGRVSESASAAVKEEMSNLMTHAQRTGTGTGRVVTSTLQEFSNRMGVQWMQVQQEAPDAFRSLGQRFSQAASGFFAAMSEALRRDDSARPK